MSHWPTGCSCPPVSPCVPIACPAHTHFTPEFPDVTFPLPPHCIKACQASRPNSSLTPGWQQEAGADGLHCPMAPVMLCCSMYSRQCKIYLRVKAGRCDATHTAGENLTRCVQQGRNTNVKLHGISSKPKPTCKSCQDCMSEGACRKSAAFL